MVLFAFKDDGVLRKILKFVARRNTKRNYFLVLTVIGPPKHKKQNKRSLSFHFDLFSGCRFVRFSGFSLISHELLDKTCIYAHHQNGLNEEIKIMCFICRFNECFSRNQRKKKCSQNVEDESFKF